MLINQYSLHRILRKTTFLIILIFNLFPGQSTGFAVQPSMETNFSLLGVEVNNNDQFAKLATLGSSYYTRFFLLEGTSLVVMPAGEELQARLSNFGLTFQVLDANLQEGSYYLLYGLPEELNRAQTVFDFLLLDGRQAVVRTNENDLPKLAEFGIKSLPLISQEMVIPRSTVLPKKTLPQTITQNPMIQEMVSQVNANTLYTIVGNLSGEWPVSIDGGLFTLATRYSLTDVPIKKATRYVFEHFQKLGLPTGYDYYPLYGVEKRNVLAQQTGITEPERIILLTAHLDSTSHVNGNPHTLAPGADDNASGSAALMHIAEIFRPYSFGCTLRYGFFTGEEQGIYGSQAYVQDVYHAGENVEAVLNLDMIAYNTPGSNPRIELHTQPGNNGDLAIANLFDQVISEYNINLNATILPDGLTFSDHSSFWTYGYPAILAIEDWSDHTPHYHKTTDRLNTLDMTYYSEFVKASLATFAHMGCLVESELRGTITATTTGEPIAGALLEVWEDNTLMKSTITKSDGTYQVIIPPGSYRVTISALDHLSESIDSIQIANGQATVLDLSLQPCIFVKQMDFIFSPPLPEIDQTIIFTGTTQSGENPITYSWTFGDGQIGNGQIISHTFSSRGSFPVRLEVNNICNIPGIIIHAVNVEAEEFYLPLIKSAPGN